MVELFRLIHELNTHGYILNTGTFVIIILDNPSPTECCYCVCDVQSSEFKVAFEE